jgi:hypothetical protein
MMREDTPMRALLRHLVDYAGLFPPAGLPMEAAVRNYASYLAGEHAWMLGRFIVPTDRLESFERAASPYFTDQDWRVALLGAPAALLQHRRGYVVDAIELKSDRPGDRGYTGAIPIYYEIRMTGPVEEMTDAVEAVRNAGGRAKIRTGGLTADAFPRTAHIAAFLARCHHARIAFKATAGLHHPVRGPHPFTYEPDSARGEMHGFLNVFLAAALILHGGSELEATQLLEETASEAFQATGEFIGWRSYRFTAAQIRKVREQFAISFGSCSFEEPVSDLEHLGIV